MSQMNLLPEYYVKQRFRNRMDMLCVILLTLVMGGVILAGTLQERKYRETRGEYESVSQRFHQETGSMDEFMRLRGKKRRLLNEAQQVSELEELIPRSYLVAMVIRALPEKVSLSVLEISEKISVTAAMTRGAKPSQTKRSRGRGRTEVTHSSDVKPDEAPPTPQMIVKIGGYAASDLDAAKLSTALKAYPITQDVHLRHTREHKTDAGVFREFQIDWELKKGVDVLDHLADKVGIVENPPKNAAGGKEDG